MKKPIYDNRKSIRFFIGKISDEGIGNISDANAQILRTFAETFYNVFLWKIK